MPTPRSASASRCSTPTGRRTARRRCGTATEPTATSADGSANRPPSLIGDQPRQRPNRAASQPSTHHPRSLTCLGASGLCGSFAEVVACVRVPRHDDRPLDATACRRRCAVDRAAALVVIGASGLVQPRRCVDAPSESRVAAGCSAIEFDHCVFDLVVRERDGVEIRCGHDGNTERLDDDALAAAPGQQRQRCP